MALMSRYLFLSLRRLGREVKTRGNVWGNRSEDPLGRAQGKQAASLLREGKDKTGKKR